MSEEVTIKFKVFTNPLRTIIDMEDAITKFLDSMHDFYKAKGLDGAAIYGMMCKNHAILSSSLFIEGGDAFNLVSKVLDRAYQTWEDELK
jgi:hypothetical protein